MHTASFRGYKTTEKSSTYILCQGKGVSCLILSMTVSFWAHVVRGGKGIC